MNDSTISPLTYLAIDRVSFQHNLVAIRDMLKAGYPYMRQTAVNSLAIAIGYERVDAFVEHFRKP